MVGPLVDTTNPATASSRTERARVTSTSMMRVFGQAILLLAGVFLGEHGVSALTAAEWRKQSIYKVVTDRFARTDLSTTAQCNPMDQVYCGGTWRGLISKLDYIKGMGFTAVWISPVVKQIDGQSQDG